MSRLADLDSLYSAVVADVLDKLGHRRQVLGAAVKPLTPADRVAGRVFTARAVPVDAPPPRPYELEMRAIDTMQAGDVLVVDVGGGLTTCAFWGELLSTACLAKGVRGVVMNGCSRDLAALFGMPFPVFGVGATPADSLGRVDVVSLTEPIMIDGVRIETGDLVLGDRDGVVVVPQAASEEAIRLAVEKVSGENTVRAELAAGVPVAEVFRRHGIL